MRVLVAFNIKIITAVALALAVGLTTVWAQEPTPTPTLIPTEVPTPTQVPTSTIEIRFVRDGQPVTIRLGQALGGLTADGVGCNFPILAVVVFSSGFSINWPLPPEPGQPLPCTQGPPTTLRFEFLGEVLGEFRRLFAEFVWNGGDMTVDIEVPGAALPTPTPAPTPTVAAQELPKTGAPPADTRSHASGAALGLIAAGVLLLLPAGASLYRRSKRPGQGAD